MARLNDVRNASRHVLAIGALILAGIFVLILLINIGKSIIETLHPTPPAPPTVSFGKLPPMAFPSNANTEKFTFSLNTLSGNLPDFGDRATVYKMQQVQPDLLALDTAKQIVARNNFTSDPVAVSDTQYKWTNSDTLQKTLVMNIFNNNFIVDSDFLNDQNVQQGNNLPDQNSAISIATTYLQTFGLFPNDIDPNKTKITLFSIANGTLTPATSLSTSQIIRIDFFQNDVNKLPIFYPMATYSTMSFLIGGGDAEGQIVEARFSHQSVTSENATYPIISAQQAFDALKNGQGYIASYDNTGTQITIHNVVLGYYIGEDTQQYLQPIIVFEGDHGFFGYVPALTANWIQKQ